ncbi:carbon-nitrogen hydrolase family protein [Amycolatopsis acidicola]|uniref:Carbon-nitrogen hydrolase family protein n=1 Tax=Amycolatopsis acidicola TaxID=2596893 RepID=A0A5N0V7J7_9PSEU|nr:carbon-nitrogen hydrolase family protein [Amycolatopsis acidicola]KAA9162327.1 carbon-nitrogen hydrolase family protein [Amycolatopsis acidicola]
MRSGYAGSDFADYRGFDWSMLKSLTRRIMALAGELGIWVVLGSSHPLRGEHKPHNSLYLIDDGGRLVDRYDKRFCAGGADEDSGDLAHYTPGNHAMTWTINGVRCGALICYDFRFPELYREYKRKDVQLVFHSFHSAHPSTWVRDQVGRREPSVDQLPEFVGAREPLGLVLRAGGRCHDGQAAQEPDRRARFQRGHGCAVVRLGRRVAATRAERDPAQWNARRRRPVAKANRTVIAA